MSEDPLHNPGGFAELVGYKLVEWTEREAVVQLPVAQKHMNRTGVLHGGVLATILDAACGFAGTFCDTPGHIRRAVTLHLDTQFIGAGRIGMLLTARGTLDQSGRSIFFSSGTCTDEEGTLIGTARGTFKYRMGSGDPKGIPIEKVLKARNGG